MGVAISPILCYMQTVYACGVSGEPLLVSFALLGSKCQLAAPYQ